MVSTLTTHSLGNYHYNVQERIAKNCKIKWHNGTHIFTPLTSGYHIVQEIPDGLKLEPPKEYPTKTQAQLQDEYSRLKLSQLKDECEMIRSRSFNFIQKSGTKAQIVTRIVNHYYNLMHFPDVETKYTRQQNFNDQLIETSCAKLEIKDNGDLSDNNTLSCHNTKVNIAGGFLIVNDKKVYDFTDDDVEAVYHAKNKTTVAN